MTNFGKIVEFGPFRLDKGERLLLREGAPIAVTGKVFDTLCALVENAGRLTNKNHLLTAVWGDTAVEENNLTYCISILRKALGQGRTEQRFIETVPKQGYRFVAPVRMVEDYRVQIRQEPRLRIFGRDNELQQLCDALQCASVGARQTLFITGDTGLGKSAFVDAFLERASQQPNVFIGRGECLQPNGPVEPYMAVLAAITDLSRSGIGNGLHKVLAQWAPTWLAQLPAIASRDELSTQDLRMRWRGPDRMLREITEALVALATDRTILLVVEDVHWCDLATLDFLTLAARQVAAARLLIIATYRAADATALSHPLPLAMREIKLRGGTREIRLPLLDELTIQRWLTARFDVGLAVVLSPMVHQLTDGNPLFVETAIQSWVNDGIIKYSDGHWRVDIGDIRLDPPESLAELIRHQVQALTPVQRLIVETASIIPRFFCARVLSELIELPLSEVERECGAMAESNLFFHFDGVLRFPDGSVCDHYRFKHTLFVESISRSLRPARRIRLEGKACELLEQIYGRGSPEITPPPPLQFRDAKEHPRPIPLRGNNRRTGDSKAAANR